MGSLFKTQDSKQTSTTKLGKEQQQIFNAAMPYLNQYATTPPTTYQGSGVAGFNPTQLGAQSNLLGAAGGGQTDLASGATAANQYLMDPSILTPESNPALQGYINAANRSVDQGLLFNDLPGIRQEAVQDGQFGSSRQGIAEGLASGMASQARGDNASRIASAGYGQGLDAMKFGIGATPSTQGSLLAPGATEAAVGDVQQGMSQALLDENISKFYQEQFLPLFFGEELLGLMQGMPGSTTVNTGSGGGASPLMQLAGLGMAGASMFGGK